MHRTAVVLLAAVTVVSMVPAPVAADQSSPVTLTISVENQAGSPVGGATLTVTWNGENRTATTASNGKAFVDVDRGADVSIDATSDRYTLNTPREVTNAREQSLSITVARKGSATVLVTDRSGTPISSAIVQMSHNGNGVVNRRTGSDGRLATGVVEQGLYSLSVYKGGYFRNSTTVQVGSGSSFTRTIRRGTVTATFTVRDDHYDPPRAVEGAQIAIPSIGASAQTFGGGEATTSVPVNSNLDVSITKDGYEEVTKTLNVAESPVSKDVFIKRTPSITVDPSQDRVVVGENVSITVTDEYEAAVGNATVTLDGTEVGRTDTNGAASVRIDSGGNHTISVSSGALSDSVQVEGVSEGSARTDAPADTATSTTSGPGFTVLAGLAGVFGVVLLLRRR